jgi:hypothetical protein
MIEKEAHVLSCKLAISKIRLSSTGSPAETLPVLKGCHQLHCVLVGDGLVDFIVVGLHEADQRVIAFSSRVSPARSGSSLSILSPRTPLFGFLQGRVATV